eukprot:2638128-Karenia_brevis.AAC.1
MLDYPTHRCVVAGWPSPSLRSGAVAFPYCDSLTIFALSQDEANDGLRGVMSAFTQRGFDLHDVSWASERSGP